MVAGTLEIQMLANMAQLTSQMAQANRVVADTVSKMNAVLGTLGIGLSAGLILSKINSVIDGMAHLQRMSIKTGASVEELSKLKFFAGAAEIDIGSVTASLVKLSKGMAEAGNEGKPIAEALKFLNLSAKDLAGNLKDPAVLFGEIAKKLSIYADGAGKTAIAVALFGKAGAEMLPVMAKMNELGAISTKVTAEQAKAAEDYKLKVLALERESGVLWKTMTVAILPAMGDMVDLFIKLSKESDSFSSKVKGLAKDGSIAGWAESSAMGISYLIDVLKTLGGMLDQIAAPMQRYFLAAQAGYAAMFIKLNPFIDAKTKDTALEQLRQETDATNAELQKRFNKGSFFGSGFDTSTSDALRAQIALRKQNQQDAARDMEGSSRPGETRNPLNFALGDAKKSAAELKTFEGAMQSLEKQYFNLTHAGQASLLVYETTIGTLKKLTPEHKAELVEMARKIDAYQRTIEIMGAYNKALEAENSLNEKRNEIRTAQTIAYAQARDDEQFELELIGKSAREIELLNAQRKIELDLRQRIAALPKLDEGATTAQIQANAEAEKALRLAAAARQEETISNIKTRIDAERDWSTGAKQFFNEYTDNATNAALRVKDAFSSGFKALEDTMFEFFRHGKLNFGNFVSMIKDALARLAAQQFTVNIAGVISGALGMGNSSSGGLASLLGGGGSGGGLGVGNLFSLGSNFFGGTGGMLASGATSLFGASSFTAALAGDAFLPAALGSLGTGAVGAGAVAGAGLSAAIPYVGWALAAYALLSSMDEGGGPKPSQIGLFGDPGSFNIGQIDTPGGWANLPLYQSIAKEGEVRGFNDPAKYDQAILNSLKGQWIQGDPNESADSMVQRLLKFVEPARVAAEATEKFTSAMAQVRAQLEASKDPLGYWGGQVKDFNTILGTSVGTIDEWRDQFLGVLDSLDADDFAAWQKLGVAVEQAAQAAEQAAQAQREAAQAAEQAAQAQREAAQAAEQAKIEAVASATATLKDSYGRESDALRTMAGEWAGASSSLREYLATLSGGVTGVTYSAALRQLNANVLSAKAGDMGALENLPDSAEAFREASLARAGSALDYARDIAKIRRKIGSTADFADTQESVALQQLDALETQVSTLIDINGELVTVNDAMAMLNAATTELRTSLTDQARDTKSTKDLITAVANGSISLYTRTTQVPA